VRDVLASKQYATLRAFVTPSSDRASKSNIILPLIFILIILISVLISNIITVRFIVALTFTVTIIIRITGDCHILRLGRRCPPLAVRAAPSIRLDFPAPGGPDIPIRLELPLLPGPCRLAPEASESADTVLIAMLSDRRCRSRAA
jgi:hypothetical protein